LDNGGLSAGGSALFLTVLGAASQLLGFLYRVALSRLVGAEVMGLYQLIMPVYSVILSLTAVGLTAAVANLTARHLALGDRRGVEQTLLDCLVGFFLLLLPVGAVVIFASDAISVYLLRDARTRLGLMLLIPCVALTGVENCHKQAFYGAGLVRTPAVVELMEQVVRAAAVLGLLLWVPPQYPERTVGLIVAGMVVCEVFSAGALLILHRRRRTPLPRSGGETLRSRQRRVAAIALPVGANALLGNLLGAVNTTLIPQKLVEGGMGRAQAVSQFGVLCGMTMPMLALPTVFLGAVNLVLAPRLTAARALSRTEEQRRLIAQAVETVALLTLPAMALMVVFGPDLGLLMFRQEGVNRYLLPLAAVMAMSCFCSVLACALNAIGQQRAVALISLSGGGVQLLFTLILVPMPSVGMGGYVAGALVSTVLELLLLLGQTCRLTELSLQPFRWLIAPGLGAALAALTANLLLRYLKDHGLPFAAAGPGVLVFALLLYWAALSAQGIGLPWERAKK